MGFTVSVSSLNQMETWGKQKQRLAGVISKSSSHKAACDSNPRVIVVPGWPQLPMADQGGCDHLGRIYEKDHTSLNATD